jgi:hypothetical protein
MKHTYKDYVIEPRPYKVAGAAGWKSRTYVTRRTPTGVVEIPLSDDRIVRTREEAEKRAMQLAREAIDSRIGPQRVLRLYTM